MPPSRLPVSLRSLFCRSLGGRFGFAFGRSSFSTLSFSRCSFRFRGGGFRSGSIGGRDCPECSSPARPVRELIQTKATEVPLASRVGIQCANSSSGVRKIAPPVPVRPDRVPIAAPANRARAMLATNRELRMNDLREARV